MAGARPQERPGGAGGIEPPDQLLVQEIESHRRTDAALQQAKRSAAAANQAKTRYISAISHELRTPLNSILGYAQLLDDDGGVPEAPRRGERDQARRRPPARR